MTHYKVGGLVNSKRIYVTNNQTTLQTTTTALKTIPKRVLFQQSTMTDVIRRQYFNQSFFLFCSKFISSDVPVINPAGGAGLASFGLQ